MPNIKEAMSVVQLSSTDKSHGTWGPAVVAKAEDTT